MSDREPIQSRGKAASPRIIGDANKSGRAARQRPRPGTGGDVSHADSKYLVRDQVSEVVEIVLTLRIDRYDGFTHELDELRERTGAASNTEAILEAVRSRLASE